MLSRERYENYPAQARMETKAVTVAAVGMPVAVEAVEAVVAVGTDATAVYVATAAL
jgi:hypothetical protein